MIASAGFDNTKTSGSNKVPGVTLVSNHLQFSSKANVIMFPASSTRECLKSISSGTRVFVAAPAQNASGKSLLNPVVSICIA